MKAIGDVRSTSQGPLYPGVIAVIERPYAWGVQKMYAATIYGCSPVEFHTWSLAENWILGVKCGKKSRFFPEIPSYVDQR